MTGLYDREQGTAFGQLSALPGGTFNTLQRAIKGANLTSVLEDTNPLTLLAPTDGAFAQLSDKDVKRLLTNVTAMGEVIKNHVIHGEIGT